MTVENDYEISPTSWVRDQTEKILETGTTDSVDIKGSPVVLITMRGAKTGKLRKVPLMRVEHDGGYAIVASLGGAPEHPVWYHNVRREPARRAAGRHRRPGTTPRARSPARRRRRGGSGRSPPTRTTPTTRPGPTGEIPVFVLEPRSS